MTGVMISGLILAAVWVWARFLRRRQRRLPPPAWDTWEKAPGHTRDERD